ncbi:hypothetical protein GYMLUDRAFT_914734 [Collybiopsis luxurians FD-317 M1]|nr:hypothetical protein GYMLUDRAFT_914734 [Collybiopsis luxurians FD-317 M1]
MLVLLLSSLAQKGVAALPVAANTTVAYLAEDDSGCSNATTRSVIGIIWSCATTIFACTWVAIHPNIPAEDDSQRAIYRRRAQILIVALIVPEYIILWAANQLRSAKLAVQRLRQFPACRNWTITHGMFLVMGGFVLADDSGKRLGVIQEDDLIKLLSNGQIAFPALSSSQIMDRSKGDAITKTLVLFQTSWFVMQIVSRAIQHLPITELELTTLAFALLNFLTYMLWWKKPLDVRHPILITLQDGKSERKNLTEIFARHSGGTLDEVDITDAYWEERSHSVADETSVRLCCSALQQQLRKWILTLHPAQIIAFLNQITRAFVRPWNSKGRWDSDGVHTALTNPDRYHTPNHDHTIPQFQFTTMVGPSYPFSLEMFIGTVFGAIHCVAWTFQFPSRVEQVLWRSTSLYITCSPISIWAIQLLVGLAWPRNRPLFHYPIRVFIIFKIVAPLFTWTQPILVIFAMYIISRLTMFILALVLLRDLPSGALQEVEWTNFIPHV